MARDWSALPLDILVDIAKRLDTLEDVTYFSVVCRLWNCVPPLIKNDWKPIMPWLLLAENTKDNPTCVRKIFSLSHSKCHKMKLPETFGARCWGTPYGWVAMIDIDLNILLFNPITKARLSFPHRRTLPDVPNLKEFRITKGDEVFSNCLRQDFPVKLFVLKVQQNDHHEFVVVMILKLRFVMLARHGDLSWTPVSLPKGTDITMSDIICIDNNAYALYEDGSIRYWNLKETGSHRFIEPMAYIPGCGRSVDEFNERVDKHEVRKMYLVRSGIDLFTVFRFSNRFGNGSYYHTQSFSVLKFVGKDEGWENVQDLGDVALFVGSNISMSISTIKANYLRRSCIYFTDDKTDFWYRSRELRRHDMGVYDLMSAQKLPIYEGDSILSSLPGPTFFIPHS